MHSSMVRQGCSMITGRCLTALATRMAPVSDQPVLASAIAVSPGLQDVADRLDAAMSVSGRCGLDLEAAVALPR